MVRLSDREDYANRAPVPGEVLLFRATRKSSAFDGTLVDDTPYRDMYQGEHLGWEGKTRGGVVLCDVAAGHPSMLQEPNVAVIAERMQSYIDVALARVRHAG